MAKVKWPLTVALALLGFVWLGQGLGLIGGSFMSGDPLWAVIGALMLIGAAVLGVRRRSR